MRSSITFAMLWFVCQTLSAAAGEIGYVEEYALAADRAIALKQLIPGTEDFYYYHCLNYQNSEQYDRVEQLLQAWIQRYNYTPRVREINQCWNSICPKICATATCWSRSRELASRGLRRTTLIRSTYR